MRFRESSRKKNLTVVLEYKRHALRARGKSIYFEIQVETDKKVGVLPIRIVMSNVSRAFVREKQKIIKKIE